MAQSAFFENIPHPGTAMGVLNCDFETMDAEKQWFMADGEQFCKTSSRSSAIVRSGKYSISLPEKDVYTKDYEMKNVKPGELYEVSIWRYGGVSYSVLVASGANSDVFYAKSNSTGEMDTKGWNKLDLTFRIPAGFKENKIKLYLWNHGGKPVWFDDFKLTQLQ